MEAYYFGVKSSRNSGHELLTSDGSSVRVLMDKLPFNYEHLDGFLKDQAQSVGVLWHLYAANAVWTILTVSDYSADKRGRSNASFIFRGHTLSLDGVLMYAPQFFPQEFKRITDAAPIKLLELK